ncbi:hypothetical protein [Bradyrhizobium sp. CCBAU 53380]|uniref:hypothetical protein n=1 Tax=Bradyrhizobium sp. CCBAU 53380 TaxID=1325117 RepID=UPI0023030720|nr:hypothetical protein [Bradyrhizobium sp. CCBAU 53380]MDA9427127.1 hypothetical protein [Bradyrhizobium sp. CCBAU 53380]
MKLDGVPLFPGEAVKHMIDRDHMITLHLQMLAELGWTPPTSHWAHAYVAGDAIGTDEAAYIAGCSPQTIRRRAVEAAAAGNPIGVWFAQSVWLISKQLLLEDIERRDGRYGRNAAISRAENMRP